MAQVAQKKEEQSAPKKQEATVQKKGEQAAPQKQEGTGPKKEEQSGKGPGLAVTDKEAEWECENKYVIMRLVNKAGEPWQWLTKEEKKQRKVPEGAAIVGVPAGERLRLRFGNKQTQRFYQGELTANGEAWGNYTVNPGDNVEPDKVWIVERPAEGYGNLTQDMVGETEAVNRGAEGVVAGAKSNGLISFVVRFPKETPKESAPKEEPAVSKQASKEEDAEDSDEDDEPRRFVGKQKTAESNQSKSNKSSFHASRPMQLDTYLGIRDEEPQSTGFFIGFLGGPAAAPPSPPRMYPAAVAQDARSASPDVGAAEPAWAVAAAAAAPAPAAAAAAAAVAPAQNRYLAGTLVPGVKSTQTFAKVAKITDCDDSLSCSFLMRFVILAPNPPAPVYPPRVEDDPK